MSECFVNNYPETANITVEETTVQFDGADANWYEQSFAYADLDSGKYFALTNYPVSAGSIALYLNSGLQIQGTDYTVSGKYLTMATAIQVTDKLLVRYFAYTTASDGVEIPVGSILFYANSTPPTGWKNCDGTTSLTKADYPELWTFANANSLVLSSSSTEFILKDLSSTLGGVTVYAIIKT